jgi:glycosyltransferase involved in cell wall biosynthesis
MSAASISIVMPTHNRASLLPRALGSVFRQSDREFELVVIDDGSRDETSSVLAQAATDPRVTLLRNDSAHGAAAARNRAIQAARGDWIAFLDDDDELLPDYIAQLRAAILADPRLGLIWTGVERLHHRPVGGGETEPLSWSDRWDGLQSAEHRFLEFFALSFGVAVRRNQLLAIGLFDERFTSSEDIDLAMRLVARGTAYAALPGPLLRVHLGEGRSLSRNRAAHSELRELLLERNAAFLRSQPRVLAHYRRFAMAGCYVDGRFAAARRLARQLLCSGRIGGRGLELMLRYEVFGPLRRLWRGKSATGAA